MAIEKIESIIKYKPLVSYNLTLLLFSHLDYVNYVFINRICTNIKTDNCTNNSSLDCDHKLDMYEKHLPTYFYFFYGRTGSLNHLDCKQ